MQEYQEYFVYIGDCVTGLEDDYFSCMIASDATELQQLVEKGEAVPVVPPEVRDYLPFLDVDVKRCSFGRNERVLWAHETEKDVHYFFLD